MYLNGVILVSPTGLGMTPEGPAPRSPVLKLPYYAAAAHYHGQLDEDLQSLELAELLAEVEEFTLDEYLPALSRGGFLAEEQRIEIARRVARYAGAVGGVRARSQPGRALSSAFWKELLRDEGYTIGRLDSRYLGVDRKTRASATTTRPSSPPGTTPSRRPSITTCATSSASRPISSTTCSGPSVPGRAATTTWPRSCGRRWPRTPTST